jgi:hypothetical protein
MGEKEASDARREAAREYPARPWRSALEESMAAYLSGEAYTTSRTTAPPQPVDEPAPPVAER